MKVISLGIIDDHGVVIKGLKSIFEHVSGIELVVTATEAQQLMKQLETFCLDVLLMDIQMPGIDGIELAQIVNKKNPSIKIIAFSSFTDTHYVRQIMRSGAVGYVLKNSDEKVIIDAIHTVMSGEEYLEESIKKILVQQSISGRKRSLFEISLTKRESEILKMIADGYSNQQIADTLAISPRTVELHRFHLYQKLGVKNVASLLKEASKRGLVE